MYDNSMEIVSIFSLIFYNLWLNTHFKLLKKVYQIFEIQFNNKKQAIQSTKKK